MQPPPVLRRPGPPAPVRDFPGIVVHDPRLAEALDPESAPLLLHDGAIHAEGPVWDAPHDRLLFSDVSNRRLLAWHPDGRVDVQLDATDFINGNALLGDGTRYHCEHGRRCISRSGATGRAEPVVTRFEGRRLNAPNDIVATPDGALWFTDPTFGILMPSQGSLEEPELDHRSLYRFHPSTGALTRMADFEQPNGLAFASDHRSLYVTDTAQALGGIPGQKPGTTRDIVAFDVATDGALSNRRLFHRTDHGVPDGLAVDVRGWVWTSAADGVHVLDAEGRRLGFIPTDQVVTNCTFAPGRLFVTASEHLLALDLR